MAIENTVTATIMDDAAKAARQDFVDNVQKGNALDAAAWVKKHYQTAGYKRLCRILLDAVK